MQREAVVVGADHRREGRVEIHPRVLERLEKAHRHSAEERDEGHRQVGASHPTLRGEVEECLGRRGGSHGRASTITLPHIVWCAIPQYSWQTNGYSPGRSKRAVTRAI